MCTKMLFVFASMLVLLPACRSANPTLQQAETCLEAGRPDTALSLLKGIPQKKLSKSERAHYGLLYTWAWDKCDSTIGPHIDSLMQAAAKYYAAHGDRYHRALAAYYQGRVARECHRAPEAQKDFLKALELAKGLNKHVLLCSMNSQIGLLYLYQGNAETAVRYLRQADAEMAIEGSSAGRAYTLQDLARAYSLLQNDDSTLLYYKLALQFAPVPDSSYIFNELANYYAHNEQLDLAKHYMHKALTLVRKEGNLAPFYYVAGCVFSQSGQLDSAAIYFRQVIQSAGRRLDIRSGALYQLGHLALKKGEYKKYAAYQAVYEQIKDSVDRQNHRADLLKMQSLYDYSQAKLQTSKARIQAKRFESGLIVLGIALPFAILLTWFLALRNRYKKKDRQKSQQVAALQQEKEALMRQEAKRRKEEKEQKLQNEPLVIRLRALNKGEMTEGLYAQAEMLVNKYYPQFIIKVSHQEKFSKEQIRTVYLLRLNIRTVQIASLLNIASNSATTRFKKLASIIFEGRLEKDWHKQLVNYLRELE